MRELFIICGIPGSGKSTFLRNYVKESSSVVLSRDAIRFSLLKEDSDYFEYEPIVEQMFYNGITKALQLGYDVFADQSSISSAARKKLLSRVCSYKKVNAIYVKTPLEICIKRNKFRIGRAKVPNDVIVDMYNHFSPPTFKEGFDSIQIYDSIKDNLETIIKGDEKYE